MQRWLHGAMKPWAAVLGQTTSKMQFNGFGEMRLYVSFTGSGVQHVFVHEADLDRNCTRGCVLSALDSGFFQRRFIERRIAELERSFATDW